MTKTELAYYAGLMDGEGSIGIAKHKSKTCKRGVTLELNVQISMSDPLLLKDLKATFGGSITPVKHSQRLQMWHWCIVSRKAAAFLQTIFPYLRLKKYRAQLALEFQAAKRYRQNLSDEEFNKQLEIRHEIITLNKKGLAAAFS
jgi:hypothetical protein